MNKQTNKSATRAKSSTKTNRTINRSAPKATNRTMASRSKTAVKNSAPKAKIVSKPVAKTASAQKLSTNGSTMIRTLIVNPDNTVKVVMKSNPKTEYVYAPSIQGLTALKQASINGKSVGEAYHRHLKGKELWRITYNR